MIEKMNFNEYMRCNSGNSHQFYLGGEQEWQKKNSRKVPKKMLQRA